MNKTLEMLTELRELTKRISQLDTLVDIQSTPGNYDQNEYMRGLANGLVLAQSILYKNEPKFFEVTNEQT